MGKFCNFILTLEDFSLIFYHLKALENKEFCKYKQTKPDIFQNFIKPSDFFQKPLFFTDL